MTNYEQMKDILNGYSHSYDPMAVIESNLSDVSVNDVDKNKPVMVYENTRMNMKVISMDEIAHKIYRVAHFQESTKVSESPASADGFVISSENIWYFIEFKDQKISKARESVIKKAYQNWYWLLDILYEMRYKNSCQIFDYDNPISFAKENVVYILVVSEDKNIVDVDKMRKCILADMKFQPECMKKLEKYIFKDAYVYTPKLLEREFVKKFEY